MLIKKNSSQMHISLHANREDDGAKLWYTWTPLIQYQRPLNQFSTLFGLTCGPAHERWWRPGWVHCPPPAHTSSWSYRCHPDKRFLRREQSTEWEDGQKRTTTETQIWHFTAWRSFTQTGGPLLLQIDVSFSLLLKI